MGKRRRNERMTCPEAVGFSKVRYCHDHNEEVKPVRRFPGKEIRFFCGQGCNLSKYNTVLKQKESVQRPR